MIPKLFQCLQLIAGLYRNDRHVLRPRSTELSHIQLAFRPITTSGFDGCLAFLLKKQAYTFDLWPSYRQGVHHVPAAGLMTSELINHFSPPDSLLVAGMQVMNPVFFRSWRP